ncbi:hypothetical protein [Paraburkholderia xenovorans]
MKLRLTIYLVLFAVTEYAFVHFEISYTLSDLKNYTDALLAASGMVFTIMGIWIAFLYPNALSRIVNPEKIKTADFSQTLSETRRLENIVGSVLKSAMAIVFVLILYLAKVVLSKTAIYINHIVIFKSVALSGVTVFSVLQIDAILGVVFANVMFINDLHGKREDRQMNDEI